MNTEYRESDLDEHSTPETVLQLEDKSPKKKKAVKPKEISLDRYIFQYVLYYIIQFSF